MRREAIGVLGGSFDPPHLAHVMLALLGLSAGGLTRVLVAPTFIHAFGKPLSPFEQRLCMCQLAFADLRNVEISPIERELGGVSRTLRLVSELARRHPDCELRLLIGSDILAESARWQDFEKIRELAPPLVAARVGYEQDNAELGAVLPRVSSTELRAAIERRQPAPHLPWRVREYIEQQRLYQAAP